MGSPGRERPGAAPNGQEDLMLAIVILEGIALAVLAVLVVGLLRSHAEVLRRLHELGAGIYDEDLPEHDHDHDHAGEGVTSSVALKDKPEIRTLPGVAEPRPEATTPAHDLVGVTPAGATTSVGVVGAKHTTLIAFLSSGCGTCANFWEAFHEGVELPGRDTRLVIATKSPEHESQSTVQSLAPPSVTTIMTTAAFEDYGVPVNPYFILVDGPNGQVVGEGAAATWDQVANLLRQAVADAGLTPDVRDGRGAFSRRKNGDRTNDNRDARAEAELAAAGIGPGHQSLFPDSLPIDEEAS